MIKRFTDHLPVLLGLLLALPAPALRPATPSITPSPTPECALVLDDFSNGDLTNNWGGQYVGQTPTTGTDPSWVGVGLLPDGVVSAYALAVSGNASPSPGYAYATSYLLSPTAAVDLSGVKSVRFILYGQGKITRFRMLQANIMDNNQPYFDLTPIPGLAWISYEVNLSSLTGGSQPLDLTQVVGFQWGYSTPLGQMNFQISVISLVYANCAGLTATVSPTGSISASPSVTATSTVSPTPTPSSTSSVSPTPTPSFTSTVTPTSTPSSTSTVSPTPTPSSTSTVSPTPTPSSTFTVSPTPTPSSTFTVSPTPTPSSTFTVSPTPTPSFTSTVTPTPTPSSTSTVSPTPTPSFTSSALPTPTLTDSPSPSVSATFSPTDSATPEDSFTVTSTVTPSASPTPSDTAELSEVPSSTVSMSSSPAAVASVTATFTPSPTTTVSPTPSALPSVKPTGTPGPGSLVVGPDPFSPYLPPHAVRFGFPRRGPGELCILDLERRVRRRIYWDDADSASWDGRDDAGQLLGGGVYVYVARVQGSHWRGTITLVR